MRNQSTIDKLKTMTYDVVFIDFFSIKPSERISFENKNTFTSRLGIFSSWIIIILSLLTFINFSKNMIYHLNPFNVISQIMTPDPENFELNPEKFFFAFGLQDLRNASQHYIDESIYTIEIIKRTKIGTNITLQNLKSGACNINLVPDVNDVKEYFNRNNINRLYCIQNYTDIIPEIKSDWSGPLYKNILVNVKGCKNSSSSKVICKPQEIIEAKLNNGNFVIHFTNLAINPNDYENPLTNYGKFLYTPISYNTLTYIEMVFQHLSYITDEGTFFEELKEINTVNYVSNRQILTLNPAQSVQIDMKLDKVKTIYNRKYDKIPDILARLGGIIKAIMMIMKFLVMPFIQLNFRKKLANSVYDFDLPYTKEQKKKNNLVKINVGNKKHVIQNKIKLKNYVDNSNKNSDNQQNVFNQPQMELKIGLFEYICSWLKSEAISIKRKLLDKGLSQIDKKLDIQFIISKLVEIDKLKKILLNQDQLQLFNYIQKPKLSINERKNNLDSHKSSFILKSSKTYNSFINIYKNDTKSELDNKIIEMVISRTNDKSKMKNLILKLSESQKPPDNLIK